MSIKPVAWAEEAKAYIKQYGGLCRDCADAANHVLCCPSSGIPCGEGADKAIERIVGAIEYGINNRFLTAPAIPDTHRAVSVEDLQAWAHDLEAEINARSIAEKISAIIDNK
jgi:hypothetical protein